MSEYIKIPVTQEMRNALKECESMEDRGEEKDCCGCSLNGGDIIGCLDGYDWLLDDPEHPASGGASALVPAEKEA